MLVGWRKLCCHGTAVLGLQSCPSQHVSAACHSSLMCCCLQLLVPTLQCTSAGVKAVATWSNHLLELHAWRLALGQNIPSRRLPTRVPLRPTASDSVATNLQTVPQQVISFSKAASRYSSWHHMR